MSRKPFRQGDVLIIPTKQRAVGKQVKRDNGRVVLAYGEVTGHSHAIKEKEAELYELPDAELGDRFLKVLKEGGVDLVHEEHATITIPKGNWIARIKREWSPLGDRQVID